MTDIAVASWVRIPLSLPKAHGEHDADVDFADCIAGSPGDHSAPGSLPLAAAGNSSLVSQCDAGMSIAKEPSAPGSSPRGADGNSALVPQCDAGMDIANEPDASTRCERAVPLPVPESATRAAPADTLGRSLPVPSRLYPAHWFGNGYLSLSGEPRALLSGAGVEPAQARAGMNASSFQQAGRTAPSAEAERAGGIVGPSATPDLPVPMDRHSSGEPANADRFVRAFGSPAATEAAWTLRKIRLTTQTGGMATAWLRDFTLKPTDLQRAIESVLQYARSGGVGLDRIVINGREVWRMDTVTGEF